MSKFRWKKGEHDSLFNKIKRFNNKIKDAVKKGYSNDLPNSINYKETLNIILSNKNYSREEFNSKMKFIDNFLNKNALDVKKGKRGARIPVWEFKEIKNKVKEINKKRMIQKHKLEEEEATDRGQKLGYKVKEVPDLDLATNKIRKKNFNWKRMSTSDFDMFKKTLWEFDQSIKDMDNQMYKNYRKAIVNEMNTKDAWELRKIIKELPHDLVIKKIYNDLNLGFKFVYTQTDYDDRFTTLKQAWEEIAEEFKNSKE